MNLLVTFTALCVFSYFVHEAQNDVSERQKGVHERQKGVHTPADLENVIVFQKKTA